MSGTDHSHHLQELEHFFGNATICRDSFRLLIHFAIRLAAAGHTREVLTLVLRSPEAAMFQPLADGLRLHLRMPMQHADGATRKLALQIASKISDEVASHKSAASFV